MAEGFGPAVVPEVGTRGLTLRTGVDRQSGRLVHRQSGKRVDQPSGTSGTGVVQPSGKMVVQPSGVGNMSVQAVG